MLTLACNSVHKSQAVHITDTAIDSTSQIDSATSARYDSIVNSRTEDFHYHTGDSTLDAQLDVVFEDGAKTSDTNFYEEDSATGDRTFDAGNQSFKISYQDGSWQVKSNGRKIKSASVKTHQTHTSKDSARKMAADSSRLTIQRRDTVAKISHVTWLQKTADHSQDKKKTTFPWMKIILFAALLIILLTYSKWGPFVKRFFKFIFHLP